MINDIIKKYENRYPLRDRQFLVQMGSGFSFIKK